MMVMIDTCQANTLYASIYSPNVLATGSSALGENSYSHHNDMDIGVAVIDSFTHHVLQYLERVERGSNATMREFVGPPLLLPFPFLTVYSSASRSSTFTTPKKSNPTPAYGRIYSRTIFPRRSLRISLAGLRRWRCPLIRRRTIVCRGQLLRHNRQSQWMMFRRIRIHPPSPLRHTAKICERPYVRQRKIGSSSLCSWDVCGFFSGGLEHGRVGGRRRGRESLSDRGDWLRVGRKIAFGVDEALDRFRPSGVASSGRIRPG
jgi:hypothetical protein